MANKLNGVMPGSGGNSCLERYEYAKHGVCFGFDPDNYFGTMVRLNGEIKQSHLGAFWPGTMGKPLAGMTSTPRLLKPMENRTSGLSS